ncbi:MAG: Holliday junction resolvase RecU [Ruminococcus sp.]|nr:Holliday junction resolvase RecU [Ruminiclostridium sp.]MBP1537431.1 Holliday junction resolvase RecU [Ruminococcus sp.]
MNNRKSAQASLRGKMNREEGGNFEQMIEAACNYYRSKGKADIEKTPEPIRQIGKKNERGQFLACYEKKAQPDFKGTLSGGQSIVFDAKSTITDRIAVSVLSEEQRKHLILHDRLGAKSGVMVAYSFKHFFFIPIDKFLNAKEINGHAYWTPLEAELAGTYIRYTGTMLDFLEVLMRC